MLDKAHHCSGRLVRGRMVCVTVVLTALLLLSLPFTGASFAAAPLTGAIASVTTAGASTAAAALAPAATTATQALNAPQSPPANAAPHAPAPHPAALTAAPLGKAAASNGGGYVTALAGAAPPSVATAAVTALAKTATQGPGHVVEPVSKAVTPALGPIVNGAGRVIARTGALIPPASSSLDAAASTIVTAVAGSAARARVPAILSPARSGEGGLVSVPQGAPAALRDAIGAIGAIGRVLWGTARSTPLASALEGLESSLAQLVFGPRAARSATTTLAQRLPGPFVAYLAWAAGNTRASLGGSGSYGRAIAVARAPQEAISGPLAGTHGCTLGMLQGWLGRGCGAGRLPGVGTLSSPRPDPRLATVPALGSSTARAAPAGSGGARADPGAGSAQRSVPGPVPGASSGSSGAFGFSVPILLALACLLLLAAPHAMRRLRLPREPWLQARFVLIPERPG
jgi:hypothetical protein